MELEWKAARSERDPVTPKGSDISVPWDICATWNRMPAW